MTSVKGDNKKRKVEKKSQENKCGYFIAQKQRTCGMLKKEGFTYCSEHMIHSDSKRVPCPLDNKHTVWEHNLKAHLKKCNAKPKEEHPVWYDLDRNIKLILCETNDKETDNKTNDQEINDDDDNMLTDTELFDKYIPILEKVYGDFEPLSYCISEHKGLNNRLLELENQKHAIQQSTLIGNLKARGLLRQDQFYVEFGCGKAELSRYLNLCMLEDCKQENKYQFDKYGFGLIDRGVNRMKNDSKIIKETQEFNKELQVEIPIPKIQRTRIDIKDLDLSLFIEQYGNINSMVAISKHLCGVATDLTLKLIMNSDLVTTGKFGGVLIAMCCRHICQYEQLLPQSRDFLAAKGFSTKTSFNVLKKACSWAICGTGKVEKLLENIDTKRREQGIAARRLIDESRLHAIKVNMPDYDSEIFWYSKEEVTLENVGLCIRKKE